MSIITWEGKGSRRPYRGRPDAGTSKPASEAARHHRGKTAGLWDIEVITGPGTEHPQESRALDGPETPAPVRRRRMAAKTIRLRDSTAISFCHHATLRRVQLHARRSTPHSLRPIPGARPQGQRALVCRVSSQATPTWRRSLSVGRIGHRFPALPRARPISPTAAARPFG
jgi:hypothetical protein